MLGAGDGDFYKETHLQEPQNVNKNVIFVFVLSNVSFLVKRKYGQTKKIRKVKQKNNWVRMKDKKKKARQLEREPYNEPIKQGKDKHCADQAESLLDKKKEAQPGEWELNKDKDTGTAKKRPGCKQMEEGRRRRGGEEERRRGGEEERSRGGEGERRRGGEEERRRGGEEERARSGPSPRDQVRARVRSWDLANPI